MAHAKHHGGAHIKLVAFPCEDTGTAARYDVPASAVVVSLELCCLQGINFYCCERMRHTSSIMQQDNQSHCCSWLWVLSSAVYKELNTTAARECDILH